MNTTSLILLRHIHKGVTDSRELRRVANLEKSSYYIGIEHLNQQKLIIKTPLNPENHRKGIRIELNPKQDQLIEKLLITAERIVGEQAEKAAAASASASQTSASSAASPPSENTPTEPRPAAETATETPPPAEAPDAEAVTTDTAAAPKEAQITAAPAAQSTTAQSAAPPEPQSTAAQSAAAATAQITPAAAPKAAQVTAAQSTAAPAAKPTAVTQTATPVATSSAKQDLPLIINAPAGLPNETLHRVGAEADEQITELRGMLKAGCRILILSPEGLPVREYTLETP